MFPTSTSSVTKSSTATPSTIRSNFFSGTALQSPGAFVRERSVFYQDGSSSIGHAGNANAAANVPAAIQTPLPNEQQQSRLLAEARQEISKLRHELSQRTNELERAAITNETAKTRLESTATALQDRIDTLEKDRKVLFDSESALKELLEDCERRNSREKKELHARATMLQTNLLEMEQACADMREQAHLTAVRASNQESELGLLRRKYEQESRLYQQQIEEGVNELRAAQKHALELENKLESAGKKSQSAHTMDYAQQAEVDALCASLSSATAKIHSLEASNRKLSAENAQLKELVQNNNILKEQMHALETRLAFFHGLEDRHAQLEVKHAQVESEYARLNTASASENILLREYTERTLEAARLREQFGNLNASLKSKEAEVEYLHKEIAALKEQLQGKGTLLDDALQQQVISWRRQELQAVEIKNLRAQIIGFAQVVDESEAHKALMERIAQLEKLLDTNYNSHPHAD